MLCLVLFCSRKAFTRPHKYLESMVKHNKKSGVYGEAQQKAATNLFALCVSFCLFAVEWPLNGTQWVFCPWKINIYTLFQKYFKKGNILPQSNPRDLYTMLSAVCSWASALLLPRRITDCQIDSNEWYGLLKPQNLHSTICKNVQ